ncbi:MAG TPA: PHB depolymerase family esterase [Acidimicrobiales bacterium]|nr:PHB depolymerase family esterase [Acidimicrobiales bacterium]
MRPRKLAAVVCFGLLAACDGPSTVEPAGSPPVRPAVQFGELEVDGQRRTYRVYAPLAVDSGPPRALVMALHDASSNAETFREVTQFDRAAAAGNFVVVYPESMGITWNAGFCCGRAPEQGIDDLGFLNGVIDEMLTRYPIDPTRVYATGASNGAIMAYQLACEVPERISGVAAVGGTMVMDGCRPERPVDILAFHGTKDAHVPYHGGPTSGSPVPAPSQPALMELWAQRNGCTQVPATETAGPVTTLTWTGCHEGTLVRLLSVEGGGHSWFSEEFDGPAGAIDATQVITETFALSSP